MMDEQLAFFPCGAGSLAGILTVPTRPNGRTVLMPWGSSTAPSSGVNRVRTRLARRLAEEGFHAFRFDYPGVGESDGQYRHLEMSTPLDKEVLAACGWLDSNGLDRIVIVGNCFGGWSSLVAAPRIGGLEAMALINPPVRRDHKQVRAADEGWQWWAGNVRRFRLRKLLSPAYQAKYRKMLAAKASSVVGKEFRDKGFVGAVDHVLGRQIPLLFMYGDDDFRADFESELANGLQAAIEGAGPPTSVVTVSERLEGFGSLEAQSLLFNEVIPWLKALPEPSA